MDKTKYKANVKKKKKIKEKDNPAFSQVSSNCF